MSFRNCLQNLRSALVPVRDQRLQQQRGSLRAKAHRPSVEVLEDRHTPSFSFGGIFTANEFPYPADFSNHTSYGDCTGDGIPDRVTARINGMTGGKLFVEPGRGDGTFAARIQSDGAFFQSWWATADFDGDNQLDVITGSFTYDLGGWGNLFLSTGDGHFARQPEEYGLAWDPRGMAAGDFNSDGRPDYAAMWWDYDYGDTLVGVYLNNGDWNPPPPPPVPGIRIDDVAVTEGNAGAVPATFNATLSAASSEAITVFFATGDGTATVGSGYQGASGTLTFAPGETSKNITVQVVGDRLAESNETFVVNLSSPTNATIADGQGVGTIIDDEPRISISDATVNEGNSGTRPITFTVTLSAAYDVPVTLSYATADSTATAVSDYQAKSGALTIPAGQTSGTITVQVNGDRLAESNETFTLNLSNPNYGVIGDGQGAGTIIDDEPRISISDVSKTEGKKNQTMLFTFTVTLSAAYDQTMTTSFKTADGTAKTGDQDYVARTGTITFAPGETTKTMTIEVMGDSKREADEYFYLDLFGNSTNSLFTKNRGIGTILNDD